MRTVIVEGHKRVEMYGKSRVFAADFQLWMHVSMIPLSKVAWREIMAGNWNCLFFVPVWLLSLTESRAG
jgi:hypothetical protein